MTSLIEIYRRFPSREAAAAHLEKTRWPHGVECVYCDATTTARHAEKAKADRWQCWTFHHVSRKYLPLYLRELSYRYNLRHGPIDLDGVLHLAIKPQSA